MGRSKRDLTGQRFGRFVVLGDSGERRRGNVVWECVCDCGNRKKVSGTNLVSGNTLSCGCLRKDMLIRRCTRHGIAGKRIYVIWHDMIKRCYDTKNRAYLSYGGRGITVCDEWRNDVTSFKDWALANGYNDTLTIERIDVDGNYCPENCTWATKEIQNYNKRNTVRYKGKSLRLWAKELGLDPAKVYHRFYVLNWPLEEALELKEHVFSREKWESCYHYRYIKEYNKRK